MPRADMMVHLGRDVQANEVYLNEVARDNNMRVSKVVNTVMNYLLVTRKLESVVQDAVEADIVVTYGKRERGYVPTAKLRRNRTDAESPSPKSQNLFVSPSGGEAGSEPDHERALPEPLPRVPTHTAHVSRPRVVSYRPDNRHGFKYDKTRSEMMDDLRQAVINTGGKPA